MRKYAVLIVCAVLFVLGLAGNELQAANLKQPLFQGLNTPVAPDEPIRSLVTLRPALLDLPSASAAPQTSVPVSDQATLSDAHYKVAQQRAKNMRLLGQHFSIPTTTSPVAPVDTCQELLLNSALDVTEYGDGTGSVENWTILNQNIYYDTQNYRSANYSLLMLDETDGSDTDVISSTLDYDQFGQSFSMPGSLTSITVNYSTLYANQNDTDMVWGNLWTLDAQGYLDQLVLYWTVGGSSSWTDRFVQITDAATLQALQGKSVAFTFDMASDRTAPGETIWLDDVQVTACYSPKVNRVNLPIVIRQPSPSSNPTCTPYEPDSKDQRGSVDVGATCNGSFGQTDLRDYYTLNLLGINLVRLQLSHLPAGSNWDALIYENTTNYPLVCQIMTTGSQDKYKDCPTLNLNKQYFVVVNTGKPPSNTGNTYQLSVISRIAPTPTPTPTPPPVTGIYGQVKYDGSPVAGVYLTLRFYNGSSWFNLGLTHNDRCRWQLPFYRGAQSDLRTKILCELF